MDLQSLAEGAADVFRDSELTAEPMPGLILLRRMGPSSLEASLYEPVVCLILQGRKATTLAGRTVDFGPGESLVVSHDLPVVYEISEASRDRPYLALVLSLELSLLRGLYEDLDGVDLDLPDAHAVDVHPADPAFVDALGRYLALANDPVAARVLGPLVKRELHVRLVLGPQGAMLRQLVQHDSHAARVGKAIAVLRREFRTRVPVPELARVAGMSASAFHQHFKAITATTPLQYQKELRLLEAHRLLRGQGHSVSEAAFAVGYESASQFSREYARKFGAPPSRAAAGLGA